MTETLQSGAVLWISSNLIVHRVAPRAKTVTRISVDLVVMIPMPSGAPGHIALPEAIAGMGDTAASATTIVNDFLMLEGFMVVQRMSIPAAPPQVVDRDDQVRLASANARSRQTCRFRSDEPAIGASR